MNRLGSQFDNYALNKLYTVSPNRVDSFRAALYIYARRRQLFTKSYIEGPKVVFMISKQRVAPLPGAPLRGSKSHRTHT